jgi:2-C-methyl-D-erythritol 4-phosphate cytidylyltransferase
MRRVAIIPAGGTGSRSGYSLPKQFLKINGKEMIIYTLEIFQRSSLVDAIAVAVHPKYFMRMKKLKIKYGITKLKNIVEGGGERQDSVFNALSSLELKGSDLVIVHDAARPMLPVNVLNRAIRSAQTKGNALVCIKAGDTLLKSSENSFKYIDRSEIYYVQTPQIFRFDELTKGMKLAYKKGFIGTDESSIMHFAGYKIFKTEGSHLNFKITTADDIKILKKLTKTSSK